MARTGDTRVPHLRFPGGTWADSISAAGRGSEEAALGAGFHPGRSFGPDGERDVDAGAREAIAWRQHPRRDAAHFTGFQSQIGCVELQAHPFGSIELQHIGVRPGIEIQQFENTFFQLLDFHLEASRRIENQEAGNGFERM